MSLSHLKSAEIFARSRQFIPGGCVSLNRRVDPEIAFVRGEGAYITDADGNRYIDYHAAFAPFLMGHACPEIDAAVQRAMTEGWLLSGSGTAPWEAEAAELLCRCVPTLQKVQFATTGSEATYHALRLSRAFTGRTDIVVMQGGYNGYHDEVACNVMTPLPAIGPRVPGGEYPFVPLSAGMPPGIEEHVHVVGFNDLQALENQFKTGKIACLLSEPILQNIGVVKPLPGYWQRVRELCTEHGVVLAMDEVKTGFRHAIGGYQSVLNITPDLSIFGKAIANGYPLGAIGGRAEIMDLFDAPDSAKRVMISGTYNGHPLVMAAAIACMRLLLESQGAIHARLEALGNTLQTGLQQLFDSAAIPAVVVRQASAFCVYFMDHAPVDWHDIVENHNMELDVAYRHALIERGIYQFPLATKQGSISAAHTETEIEITLDAVSKTLKSGLLNK
jgi:glutamate-1-semialdehyde 2,1-aminomutase